MLITVAGHTYIYTYYAFRAAKVNLPAIVHVGNGLVGILEVIFFKHQRVIEKRCALYFSIRELN